MVPGTRVWVAELVEIPRTNFRPEFGFVRRRGGLVEQGWHRLDRCGSRPLVEDTSHAKRYNLSQVIEQVKRAEMSKPHD